MIYYLQEQFAVRPRRTAWNLEVVSATWLPRLLRRLFSESPDAERKSQCQLLIAGAHPTVDMGDLPYPHTVVFTYKSPNFAPVKARATESAAIGSGATWYEASLQKLTSSFEFHQLGLQGGLMQARHLAHSLHSVVKGDPRHGISQLFHAATVTRGRIEIVEHEVTEYPNNGHKREIRFPKIARDYKSFEADCQASGLAPTSCIC